MPARKPRSLKLMRGTLRKDREPKEPAIPREGRAAPPAWLTEKQRAAFEHLALETERCGTPTASFAHIIAGAAIAWCQLEDDVAAIATHGAVYESETTSGARKVLPRPEMESRNTQLRLLKSYLSELGLTPASIGRVDRAALPKPQDAKNAFRALRYFGRDTANG